MSKHVDRTATAIGWLLMAFGFGVVAVRTVAWIEQFLKATNAGNAPSWLTLLAGVAAGFSCYALGLYVQVKGWWLAARFQENVQQGFVDISEEILEESLEESFAEVAPSGD